MTRSARVRKLAGKRGGDPGDFRNLFRVGAGEREGPGAASGIEVRPFVDHARHRRYRIRQLWRQRSGPWREDEAAPATNQQRIVERRAQSCQRVADGGWRHMQRRRRTGHAALAEHGVQHEQAVEIDRREIHPE